MLRDLETSLHPIRTEVIEDVRKVLDHRGIAMLDEFFKELDSGTYDDDGNPLEFLATWMLLLLQYQTQPDLRAKANMIKQKVKSRFPIVDEENYLNYLEWYIKHNPGQLLK